MWPPASPVLQTNFPSSLRPDYFSLFPSLADRGPTSLDFITGLPPSAGNTTILTIIDWFSKAAHFVALPKLFTAIEMAQLLTTHVFSSMAFQRTSSQTEDPNLTLRYGGSSAPPWAQRSVYLLVVTPRGDRVDQSRTGGCSIVVSQNQAA